MMYPLYPRYLPDRDKVNDWYLDEDVYIFLHNGDVHLVEKGFKWDSHSVPLLAQPVFPRYIHTKPGYPNDIYAALVHDYLIAYEHRLPYPRQFVDYEYQRFMFMPEYKISKARSKWMPLAVKKFGNVFYRRDYRGEVTNNTFYHFHTITYPAAELPSDIRRYTRMV